MLRNTRMTFQPLLQVTLCYPCVKCFTLSLTYFKYCGEWANCIFNNVMTVSKSDNGNRQWKHMLLNTLSVFLYVLWQFWCNWHRVYASLQQDQCYFFLYCLLFFGCHTVAWLLFLNSFEVIANDNTLWSIKTCPFCLQWHKMSATLRIKK